MLTKSQVVEAIRSYMLQTQDEDKIRKCQDMLTKLETMQQDGFNRIVYNTLGENANIDSFNEWLMDKLEKRELGGTDFIPLNRFASYNIAGKTVNLHVVPKHVTHQQIRDSGSYLVDALEQIRTLIQNGEIEEIETIFAVSDILKLNRLQEVFKKLGFLVEKGDKMFTGKFNNPYQASLPVEKFLSEEWEELRKRFMEGKLTAKELEAEDEIDR